MGESGHWYRPTGELVLQVPYADKARAGEARSTTLRDARKMGLYPSVTTIISLLDKPGLRLWQTQEAVRAALVYGKPATFELETLEQRVQHIIEASHEKVEQAADFGSEVHLGLSWYLLGVADSFVPTTPERSAVVRQFWEWYTSSGELELERSEHSFVSPAGFAGTVDFLGLYRGQPVIADFKTQEFERVQDARYYDEHAFQLAGYAVGTGEQHRQRLSIVLSRTVPGLIATKLWPIEEAPRWDAAFELLFALWKLVKNYDPLVGATQGAIDA